MRTMLKFFFFWMLLFVAPLSFSANWLWGANANTPAPVPDSKDRPQLAVVDCTSRDFDGSPALAITFNEPLDARHDYNALIQVFEMPLTGKPEQILQPIVSTNADDVANEGGTLIKGAWVVGKNPRLLFFPHIKPEARYVVYIQPGVPGRATLPTNAESRYSVLTPSVPPAYYFASRGTVLPADNNGGLPVVTVNVPEVDVQFLRVKPDQLARFLDIVIRGKPLPRKTEAERQAYWEAENRHRDLEGAVSNWVLDELNGMTESVYTGRFLTEQKANKRNVTFIPVEDIKLLAEPGIYVAAMSQPGRFRYDYQTTYFYISNLGLSVRIFAKEADAWVNSLAKGKAVKNVTVSWLDENGKVLLTGKTDAQGRAHFAERPAGAKVLMAQQGKEISLIALKEAALDLSDYDIGGLAETPVKLFAYSGRNLYRPGETFAVSVLARTSDGQPIASQPIQALLKGPDGKEQSTTTWNPANQFDGYYQNTLSIPADAATGFWTLELRADPAAKKPTTIVRFNVEEFLPERMKLDLSTEYPFLNQQQEMTLKVQGNYLYGAPASGNRLLGVVNTQRAKNPFTDKLSGYIFGDIREDSASTRVNLNETTLDASGQHSYPIDLSGLDERQSPFTIKTTVSLLEAGGRPVIRTLERTYWPAKALLGLRPLYEGDYAKEDSPAHFEVVRVDAQGKFSGGDFPVRLFREDRNYYWRFSDQSGWTSGYSETDELVATTTLSFTAEQRGKLTLPVEWGRYRLEILDPETKKQLVYRFYAGWYASSAETQGVRPDLVTLKLDQPRYKEGDTARLTIKPPHAGEALLTVEGDRTLYVDRFSIGEEGRTIDLPIKKDWTRHDLYLSVAVLRPGNTGDNVTPARALGIVHLPLDREARKLSVNLEAPGKVEPETTLKVKVKVPQVASGSAGSQLAMVTVSAVDVGILNITRFKTPDPFAHFFGKERYGADQHDVYGRLIEKMTGIKGKLKYGGDSSGEPETSKTPDKVKLVDLFSGPVRLNSNGEADIALAIPDFNGKLRLMAVAALPDRFGSAEAEVTVAAPLVVEPALPRFLTIGDQATMALDVHNLSGSAKKVQIEVKSPKLLIKDNKRHLTLKDQEKVTLTFPIESGSAFGLTPITLEVSGGLKFKREFALDVLSPTPRRQEIRAYTVAAGKTLTIREADLGGFTPHTVQAHLSVGNQPPIDVKSAVQGLLMYPYGCTEQTTSSAYPHVFIDAETAKLLGMQGYTRSEREKMLAAAIARLAGRQAPNGGFSLWGNASNYEYWLSAYVGNFLLDARENHFAVPDAMHNQTQNFLLKGLQEGVATLPKGKLHYDENSIWNDRHYGGSGRFAVLAYGAYVLARESKAPLSTLRQMFELREQAYSNLSLVHLGIALTLMGDAQKGQIALDEAVNKVRPNDWYNYWWGDYGSSLRNAALSYALLQRHGLSAKNMESLVLLARDTLHNRSDWSYTSTQEKLALFLMAQPGLAPDPQETLAINLSTKAGTQNLVSHNNLVTALSADDLRSGVKVHNPGKSTLYLELTFAGNPVKMPTENSKNFKLRRTYYDADGHLLEGRPLKVGETLWVALEIEANGRIPNALIVDKVPAGIEIENINLNAGESAATVRINGYIPAEAMANPNIDHVEYREDRFVVAMRLPYWKQWTRLYYRVRVVTPGVFVVPPLYVEDMYRPAVWGMVGGNEKISVEANSKNR